MTYARPSLQAVLIDERVEPATGFAYVHCDVPAGVTLDEWRRVRNRARRAAEIAAHRERRRALVAHVRRCIGQR